ncbi:hypothetical protein FACS189479_07550 [Spirochaetia bacterium]|nr:hypothetical protein FACS189479_07550 [Spirochaetia bacterium]
MFRKILQVFLKPIFLIAFSLAAALLLLALGFASAHIDLNRASYAVLVMDESAPDREITRALSQVFNGQILSESSQWVFLDDFGQLWQIPLDEYDQRLESFDPRNDGYADRVRSFFVRGGKRFFFIPRKGLFGAKVELEKRAAAALETVQPALAWSFASQPESLPRPLGLYLVLFVASSLTGLFFLKPRLLGAVLFPVLAGLSLLGTPGFALAAVLSLLPDLLAEPVRELCCILSVPGPRHNRSEFRSRLWRNSLAPHLFRWIPFSLLSVFYGLAALAGQVPWVLGVLTFLIFTLILIFFFIIEAKQAREWDHIPFVPVRILELPLKRFNVSRVMLPFALAFCLAFLFSGPFGSSHPPNLSGTFAAGGGFEGNILISATEYRAHAEYQRRFSLLPLGRNGFDEVSYFHYDMDQDGLIMKAGALEGDLSEEGLTPIPPFPLETLMDFLGKSDSAVLMRDGHL